MITCPKCQEEIGSMSMHYCPLIAEMPAKEKADDRLHPTAGSPSSCLDCRHHREYMTHLTATVKCLYPRERAPQVVDMTIFLHGNAVMPLKAAVICPHFEAPIPPENSQDHAPR
jgi:hypothetical protein